MSTPTACWQPFPFLDHRTCAEVGAERVCAAKLAEDAAFELRRARSAFANTVHRPAPIGHGEPAPSIAFGGAGDVLGMVA